MNNTLEARRPFPRCLHNAEVGEFVGNKDGEVSVSYRKSESGIRSCSNVLGVSLTVHLFTAANPCMFASFDPPFQK